MSRAVNSEQSLRWLCRYALPRDAARQLRRGGCLAACGCIAATLSPALASAGNLDSYYLSGEAALQGGAITADAQHGGAIWYNPAGLANVDGSRLDGSVNAYALSFGGHPDIAPTSQGAEVKRLRTLDVRVVPAALSFVRHLGNVTVGVGVFVPHQQTMVLRTQVRSRALTSSNSGDEPSEVGVDVYGRVQDYYVGPSFGLALTSRINFGASLFVNYRNYLSIADAELSYAANGTRTSVVSHSALDWQQVGLQPLLGLQLSPHRAWRVGFALRLPTFRIYELRQSVDMNSVGASTQSGNGASVQASNFNESSGISTGWTFPMRFHAGVSQEVGRTRWALDVSYLQSLSNAELRVDWKPIVNGRLGARHLLNDRWAVGGGIFTDRSPERRVRAFGDAKVDYYGVTFCMDIGTLYRAARVDGQTAAPPGAFRFGTTVALSYALGLGEVVGVDVDFTRGPVLPETPRSVRAHEFSLQLATSLAQ